MGPPMGMVAGTEDVSLLHPSSQEEATPKGLRRRLGQRRACPSHRDTHRPLRINGTWNDTTASFCLTTKSTGVSFSSESTFTDTRTPSVCRGENKRLLGLAQDAAVQQTGGRRQSQACLTSDLLLALSFSSHPPKAPMRPLVAKDSRQRMMLMSLAGRCPRKHSAASRLGQLP